MAYGITPLFVDAKNNVLNRKDFNGLNRKWIKNGKYNNPMSGVLGVARIISTNIGDHKLILLYKARSWYYYFLQIIFIIAIPITLFILVMYLRKNLSSVLQWAKAETRSKEILEQAVTLQKESILFSKECEEKMVQMRVSELEKLRIIGRHLESLHSSLQNNRDESKMLNEVI